MRSPGLAKLAGGPLAADPARRARLASGGYLGTAVATAAIGTTTVVWQVGGLRAFAWASRGIRGPARDLILTTLTPRHAYGRAIGVERAGDNIGAIIGPLLAAGLVGLIGARETILLSLLPGCWRRWRSPSPPANQPAASPNLPSGRRCG